MPKSKRSRLVTLSKTQKKGKELSQRLYSNVRESLDRYQTCFVFSVENMRNTFLKDVRTDLADSRIFFGKTKVMAKALGTTKDGEYQTNLHQLAKHLTGSVGLLFTNRPPPEIESYIATFHKSSFARAGLLAPQSFTIPSGTVHARGGAIPTEHDVPLEHSLEPTVRALGMPTRLVRGAVVLDQEFVVCEEGQVLDGRQTRLLKLFGVETAEFRIRLIACWRAGTMEVEVFDGA